MRFVLEVAVHDVILNSIFSFGVRIFNLVLYSADYGCLNDHHVCHLILLKD